MARARHRHLPLVVGGDAAHVIVHGGKHGDRLLGDVHTREDHGCLRDARQAHSQLFRGEVMQLQVHVILLRATASGEKEHHAVRSRTAIQKP